MEKLKNYSHDIYELYEESIKQGTVEFDAGDIYRISFIYDTEAFFSLEAETDGQGEAMY